MLSAFTIVRNAVKLDFPIIPAIRSVLEVCDEVVVNVDAMGSFARHGRSFRAMTPLYSRPTAPGQFAGFGTPSPSPARL